MDINALNANLNRDKWGVRNFRALKSLLVKEVQESLSEFMPLTKYSLQGTTQGRYLTGGVPPVRFSM